MLEQIQEGINEILTKTGDDWFIIIEEPSTEKFVQFTYDDKDGLLFDLPKQALTEAEFEKACDELAKYHIYLETAECLDKPGGVSLGEQQSFTSAIGHNGALASFVAYMVFKNIFGFNDDTSLSIAVDRF